MELSFLAFTFLAFFFAFTFFEGLAFTLVFDFVDDFVLLAVFVAPTFFFGFLSLATFLAFVFFELLVLSTLESTPVDFDFAGRLRIFRTGSKGVSLDFLVERRDFIKSKLGNVRF